MHSRALGCERAGQEPPQPELRVGEQPVNEVSSIWGAADLMMMTSFMTQMGS